MQTLWKAGDLAYFDPERVVGGKGFGLRGILVPVADLPKKIRVLVVSVNGDVATVAIDGGKQNGATGKASTKHLIPILSAPDSPRGCNSEGFRR